MFDIGFLEMMTIGIVALVVIGPERLPEVAAKVGRYVGKAQRFVRGVKSDISRELETGDLKKLLGDQKDQIDELRTMVHTATKDIKSSTNEVFKDAENSIGSLKSEITKSEITDSSGESRVDASATDNNVANTTNTANTANTTSADESASGTNTDTASKPLDKPESVSQTSVTENSESNSNKAS